VDKLSDGVLEVALPNEKAVRPYLVGAGVGGV
jgi:hypothetical protein